MAKNETLIRVLSSAVIATAIVVFVGAGMALADSGLGVSIDVGANGNALVRGAEVTAVSETHVNAETSWGTAILNWVVKTDSETDYVNKNNKDVARSEIQVGDTISFRGTIDQAVSGLTVKAKTVKDWSKTEAKTKLHGFVSSINTSLNSFVITNGNATTTVQTNASTTFSDKGGSASFADLFLNAKVKLQGMFNASSTIFTATDVRIGTSTKEKKDTWTKDDRREWREWIRSKVWLRLGVNH